MPSNLERKARRKQQTLLTFEPVTGSSSPSANMSPANVRYQLAGKGRRQTPVSSLKPPEEEDDDNNEVLGSAKRQRLNVDTTPAADKAKKKNIAKQLFKTLPTPAKSSQIKVDSSISTLQNDSDDDSDIQLPTSAGRSGFLSAKKNRTTGYDGAADSSDGSTPENETLTPSKKTGSHRAAAKKPDYVELDSDSEPVNFTRSRAQKSVAESSKTNTASTSKRATRSTPLKKAAPARGRRAKPVQLPDTSEEDEADSEDDKVELPVNRSRGRPKGNGIKSKISNTPKKSLRKSGFIVIDSDVDKEDDDDDDDDDDPIVSSPKRSQRPLHKPAKVASDSEGDIRSSPLKRRSANNVMQDEDEDSEPIVSPLKRVRQPIYSEDSDTEVQLPQKRQRNHSAQNSSSNDDFPSPSSLSGRKDKGKGRARSAETEQPETPTRPTRQQKGRRHRTEKEKQMELLKRRRAGENIDELTESESEEDEDDDDDFQKLDVFDDEEEEEEGPKRVRKQVKVKRQRGDSSDEEPGESDFVIEDDEGPIGVPDYSHLMPLQFTHAAHRKLGDHFKDVVEWMVQNKLNPGFTWNDPVYEQAFRKLDTEYLGYADSKFVSTQWTAEFTRAVYARPTLMVSKLAPGEGIDVLGEAKCEPCNHRNHHPSFALQFTGKAYHKATLEEISDNDDSDEEDDEDSDKESVNSKGQVLPSQDKIWMSGSICAQNAEQAHTLIHWRWHLNDWVISNLEDQGYLTPEKLAEREKMTTNKRMKFANKVVDQWEADKTIKQLYHDFKSQLETARELKAQARGGWK